MSALADAIATEISEREDRKTALGDELIAIEERKTTLAGELGAIDGQLQALRSMAEQAQTLNGGGSSIVSPSPGETPKRAVEANGDRARSSSPGRKGGEAPGGRRPQSAGRRPGSAPSGSSRGASATTSGGGGAKRAAVLAYVDANGKVKTAQIAAAVGLTPVAVKDHLKHLMADGKVQAEGQTVARVYFTTTNGDAEAAAKGNQRRLNVTVAVRQSITDAIARDPGALTEQRLAQALGLDRELIADACGQLLDDDEIVLAPDATYTISRGGGAGSVDLRGRVMKILQASTSTSLLASQIAVQVSRDGHGPVSTPDVRDACTELESTGTITRSGGFGGQHRWAATR